MKIFVWDEDLLPPKICMEFSIGRVFALFIVFFFMLSLTGFSFHHSYFSSSLTPSKMPRYSTGHFSQQSAQALDH